MINIIINPASRSGKGKKLWNEIEPVLIDAHVDYKVYFSQKTGHVCELVKNISNEFFSKDKSSDLNLIILGGDGTINEALQGVSDFSRTRIGYVPTGSSNDLARDLKLPKDPKECIKNIINCKEPYHMDLGVLTYNHTSSDVFNKRFFDVSSGIGFDAAVCEEVSHAPLKAFLNKIGLGKLVYLIVALKLIFTTSIIGAEITIDNQEPFVLENFLFATFMIHKYEGGGFKFCPDADCSDGILDMCCVSNISKLTFLRTLPKALKGKHTNVTGIDIKKAETISIKTSVPCWVHTDGEVTAKSDSITITCRKEAIRLMK